MKNQRFYNFLFKQYRKQACDMQGVIIMKNKENMSCYCWLIASACFLISAIVNLFSDYVRYLSVVHLCLAGVFLYLAVTHKRDSGEK